MKKKSFAAKSALCLTNLEVSTFESSIFQVLKTLNRERGTVEIAPFNKDFTKDKTLFRIKTRMQTLSLNMVTIGGLVERESSSVLVLKQPQFNC